MLRRVGVFATKRVVSSFVLPRQQKPIANEYAPDLVLPNWRNQNTPPCESQIGKFLVVGAISLLALEKQTSFCDEDENNTSIKKELIGAIRKNDFDTLKSFDDEELRVVDSNGNTLIHLAARMKKVSVVKYLIQRGLNINAANNNGETLLHLAVYWRNEDFQFLGETDLDFSKLTHNNDSILHLLFEHSNIACIKYVIKSNKFNWETLVNFQNHNGETWLHKAVKSGSLQKLKYLFSLGVQINLDIKTKSRSISGNMTKGLSNIQSKIGFELDSLNPGEETALFIAMRHNNYSISKYLIQRNADIFTRNENGDTLLHMLSQKKYSFLIELLYVYSSPELFTKLFISENIQGNTPCHIIASDPSFNLSVIYLLFNKLNNKEILINIFNNKKNFRSLSNWKQRTPKEIARSKNSQMLLDLFESCDISNLKYQRNTRGEEELVEIHQKFSFDNARDEIHEIMAQILENQAKILDLSWRNITDDDMHFVADAIKFNNQLKFVNLSYNKLSPKSILFFLSATRHLKTLMRVHVHTPAIFDETALNELIEELKYHPTFIEFGITEVPLLFSLQHKKISSMIKSNRDNIQNYFWKRYEHILLDSNIQFFSLENACSLAKASCLAYETESKIKAYATQWGFESCIIEKNDTRGVLLSDDKNIIISFRGTNSVNNVYTDISAFLTTSTVLGDAGIHKGFHSALEDIWPILERKILEKKFPITLWFTGHSLGAALATLAAGYFLKKHPEYRDQIKIYTFGSPRVGDKNFDKEFSNLKIGNYYRVINADDVVTLVGTPTVMGYKHVGEAIYIDPEGYLYGEYINSISKHFFSYLDELSTKGALAKTAKITYDVLMFYPKLALSLSSLPPNNFLSAILSNGVCDHSMATYLEKLLILLFKEQYSDERIISDFTNAMLTNDSISKREKPWSFFETKENSCSKSNSSISSPQKRGP